MPERRSRGDGGLSWDTARQRWVASMTVGYTPSGKRIIRRGRGRTKTEAKRKLRKIIRDYEDGLVIDGQSYTVAQAVRDWLQFGLSGRDDDTITKCTILANTHVIPALGARCWRPRCLHMSRQRSMLTGRQGLVTVPTMAGRGAVLRGP